ncbi:3',5'-cyclic AMP phosphodiesterase CpdA [Yoonia maricola]|uniref:3',5'-cyclic AMP phosphodiesterase CpdA n=1 Tax=Yoonia maricola TaxID=420999 RepID=A0A2M8WK40_9RHOB|nr:phosphodiesterase [Yoonia maricola]PJI91305.1 3',5'-cyclic AMP phosphodiesterase CpdA [Yoonia maricola]
MQKILLISDLHITAPGDQIIGLDPSQRLAEALEASTAAHPDAAALVLLGDLTHNGEPEEYRELARILANVAMPTIPMLGNHDRRDAFLAQFPDAAQTASGHIQQWCDIGRHRIITLDSLDGPPYPNGHHEGWLCDDRLAFLEDALMRRDGRHAIVCIHHPPFETGIPGMDMIKLRNGSALLDRLACHGNLHLICGHVHLAISGNAGGVPWTVLKSTCHQGIVDLVDPNPHLSSNNAGAYGLALLTDNGLILHSVDVGTEAQVFGGYTPDA